MELVHMPPAGETELVAQFCTLPNDQDTCPYDEHGFGLLDGVNVYVATSLLAA